MKKILSIFLTSALCGSALAGCGKIPQVRYTGEPVTDGEVLAALNSFEAGSFGNRFHYPNMLNDFIDSASVYRYRAENGVKDWFYCAYMKSEDYDGVDVSEAAKDTTRFYYQDGNDYVDGKHIGYYQNDSVNVADTLRWFKIESLEQVSETCIWEGIEYRLDLVMAEKRTHIFTIAPQERKRTNRSPVSSVSPANGKTAFFPLFQTCANTTRTAIGKINISADKRANISPSSSKDNSVNAAFSIDW